MKSLKITISSSQLIYDIENYAFVEGDIIETDNEHVRHQIFDITQDGNVDRVARVLNLAYTEIVEKLYPYTKSEIPEDLYVIGDESEVQEGYGIDLSLPDTFSLSTVRLLKNLIHEYLVCRVLADWISIIAPRSYAHWGEKVLLIEQRIQTSIMSRISGVKRPLKPF